MSRRRTIIRLSAVLASLAFVWACGDDSTTGPTPEPNRAPLATGTIPAQTVTVGQTATLNVASFFRDPGGLEAAQSASVTVEQGNQAPLAVGTIPPLTLTEGQTATVGDERNAQ